MDELPRDAKNFVKLAKQALPAPDPGLRARVRARVDASVALTPPHAPQAGVGFGQPVRSALVRLGSAKIGLVSGVLLIGAGALYWAARGGAVARSPARETASEIAPAPTSEPTVRIDDARVDRSAAASAQRSVSGNEPNDRAVLKRKDATRSHQLAHEMALLERASQALFAGDVEGARATLRAHRQRFHRTQLRQERDGLDLLADCMAQSGDARQLAAEFMQRNPASVLAARIERACGLSDGS
jgi:hypothetical protein